MFTITTPAADPNLLTIEEMRLIAGLATTDTSLDGELAPLRLRISAEIHTACRISVGPGNPPTLRRETLSEMIRLPSGSAGALVLSRRHDIVIASITADGALLVAADYEVDPESGLLTRLYNDEPSAWMETKVVIAYEAGFATVPQDLIGAASDLVSYRRSEAKTDPLVSRTRIRVEGIDDIQTDYFATRGQSAGLAGSLPTDIAAKLQRYMNWRAP